MKNLSDFKKDYEGFKKISHSGGSLITCVLYNPETKQREKFIVDDNEYTYGDGLIDTRYNIQTLEYIRYTMQIDEIALHMYYQSIGQITEGATVKVYKGRKYPIGLTGVVKSFYNYKICYNKTARYAVLTTGEKINIDNLKLEID